MPPLCTGMDGWVGTGAVGKEDRAAGRPRRDRVACIVQGAQPPSRLMHGSRVHSDGHACVYVSCSAVHPLQGHPPPKGTRLQAAALVASGRVCQTHQSA